MLNKSPDIMVLTESWLKPVVSYNLEIKDYVLLNYPRSSMHRKARRNSGGIVIYIQQYLYNFIVISKIARDRVWMRIKAPIINANRDVYLCTLYVPPIDSSSMLTSDSPWDEIQSEIIKFIELGDLILIGDFNARTGNFQHGISDPIDDYDQPPYEPEINFVPPVDYDAPARVSMDTTINAYGHDLISICSANSLIICNGSYPPDNISGLKTCHTANGSSCVDYAIISSYLGPAVDSFEVGGLESFSDHCPISLTIRTPNTHCLKPTTPNEIAEALADDLTSRVDEPMENNSINYKIHWNKDKLQELNNYLQQHHPSRSNISDNSLSIETLIENFTDQLIDAGMTVGCARKTKLKAPRQNEKSNNIQRARLPYQWFDNECRSYKSEVLKSLSDWRHDYSNDTLKSRYFDLKASWKRLIKKKKRSACYKWNKSLKQMINSDPNSFWNIIRPKSKTTTNPPKISPEQWKQYFEKLFSSDKSNSYNVTSPASPINDNQNPCHSQEPEITLPEIEAAISNLKLCKSSGLDFITNEVIKSLPKSWINYLRMIFNKILQTGKYPYKWASSVIQPIYKSGNRNLPSNYRGISLITCIGKLFTRIINERLKKWAENSNILCKEQFGFQKGKRTTDALFILTTLIQKQISNKKQLYCCFVDFNKAFDSVSHDLLWAKLTEQGVNPQLIKLLKSYYSKSKSCVRTPDQGLTNMFSTTRGVKQGCNLSPLLFSLYINSLPESIHPTGDTIFPSSCVMFADDVVVFSDDPHSLQNILNSLDTFCKQLSLQINPVKTKILVFGKHPKRVTQIWKIDNNTVDIVDSYKYLGTWLSWKGDFKICLDKIYKRTILSLLQLQQRIIALNLSDIEILLRLFNTLIKPILLYNAEIWGLNDIQILENLCLKFYKFILRVPQNCSNLAVYAELGSPKLSIDASIRVFKYFQRIKSNQLSDLVSKAYSISNDLANQGYNCWLHTVRQHLKNLGYNPDFITPSTEELQTRLRDQHLQQTVNAINADHGPTKIGKNKLRYYRLMKVNYTSLEKYLIIIQNPAIRRALTKFRISNHQLSIELGRFKRPPQPVSERICPMCHLGVVEDEIHFLLICPLYNNLREPLLKLASTFNRSFAFLTTINKFTYIMSNENTSMINVLANYIYKSMTLRQNMLLQPFN